MAAITVPMAPRAVTVELLSVRDELANIVRLGTTIILGVWLYLASALSDGGATRRNLLPYQTLIGNRPAVEQRVFRELQEGLLEAEATRSTAGSWPSIASLSENAIPPFAPDPTARATRYSWRFVKDGSYINYVGLPESGGLPAWLLLVQEPEPGVPPDQAFEDQEHHRLLDGSMLHVSTWKRDEPMAPEKVIRVPQAEGWTQVYAVNPGGAR